MTNLSLYFVNGTSLELCETSFWHALLSAEYRCVRGKKEGAYRGYGTFQWTRAVQAVCLLIGRAKLRTLMQPKGAQHGEPELLGWAHSLAASLDYAIDKQACWIMDMFGVDRSGVSLCRRLVHRTNSGRKRPGPVALSLNTNFLRLAEIQLYVDGREVEGAIELMDLVKALELTDSSLEQLPASDRFAMAA